MDRLGDDGDLGEAGEREPRSFIRSEGATVTRPPKRPRDMMQLAKFVGEIATGETAGDKDPEPAPESPAARRGRARAAKLPPKKRSAIARKAARARWNKKG